MTQYQSLVRFLSFQKDFSKSSTIHQRAEAWTITYFSHPSRITLLPSQAVAMIFHHAGFNFSRNPN
jgi:hypothetical protein